MKLRPAVAALLASAPLLVATTGCGAGDPPTRLAYTSIARTRANAVAREITLRAGDLPEFKAAAHALDTQEGQKAGELPCARPADRQGSATPASNAHGARTLDRIRPAAHGSALRPWASAASDQLSAGSGYHALAAFSSVAVLPTSVAARLVLSQAKEMDIACMERTLHRSLSKGRLRVRGVAIQRLASTVPDSDASVAYQAVISSRVTPLVLYMDLTFFSYGQDVVTLTTYHSSKPVPPAMDSRLLGLLVARARAHSR